MDGVTGQVVFEKNPETKISPAGAVRVILDA
jgi:hypothetical protein